ncbi:COX15/CtaA family protein [bacterium]|nr:COX15/CtaA family protein [bacterium]
MDTPASIALPSSRGATSVAPAPWPHRLATIVAAATLPLIYMGARVTSTGSGMAVADWPTHEGHWFLPFERWTGPVAIETGHRVAGQIVGLLAVVLAFVFFLKETGMRKWLGLAALALVSVQGVVGGMRVERIDPSLAPVHGCLAQAVFAFLAAVVLASGSGWREAQPVASPHARTLRALAWATAGAAYVQVILGALFRHAIVFSIAPHGVFALVVLALAVVTTVKMRKAHHERAWPRKIGKLLHAALGAQVLLGVVAWQLRFALDGTPIDVKVLLVGLHLVMSALVLGASVSLALAIGRDLVPAGAARVSSERRELVGGAS